MISLSNATLQLNSDPKLRGPRDVAVLDGAHRHRARSAGRSSAGSASTSSPRVSLLIGGVAAVGAAACTAGARSRRTATVAPEADSRRAPRSRSRHGLTSPGYPRRRPRAPLRSRAMELWTMSVPIIRGAAERARRAEEPGWNGITFTDSQNLCPDPFVVFATRRRGHRAHPARHRSDQRPHPAPGGARHRGGDRERDRRRTVRARHRPGRHRPVPSRPAADAGRRVLRTHHPAADLPGRWHDRHRRARQPDPLARHGQGRQGATRHRRLGAEGHRVQRPHRGADHVRPRRRSRPRRVGHRTRPRRGRRRRPRSRPT